MTVDTECVYSLAFSPDGKILASGCAAAMIHVWDVHTGECKKTLTGYTSWINSLAFSPDNKILVSGGHDGSVLLWEMNP